MARKRSRSPSPTSQLELALHPQAPGLPAPTTTEPVKSKELTFDQQMEIAKFARDTFLQLVKLALPYAPYLLTAIGLS